MAVAEPIERREERLARPLEPRPRRPRDRGPRGSGGSDRPARLTGAALLVGVAVTHAFDVPSHLESSPYLGVMFIGLIVSSLLLAVMLVRNWHVGLAWPVSAILAANAMVGYLWSRTIGLPQIEDHVGAWNDAFGTASLVFEAALIGLGISVLRPATMKFARGAGLVGAGIIGGGLVLGAAAGHGHGGAGHHEGMDVDTATAAQKAEAKQLQRETMAVAQQRFPTFAAAQAAGYKFAPRSFKQQKDLDFWHLTHGGAMKDGREVDPRAPESLMYWNSGDGPPKLMATVYRVPTRAPNPAVAGPIIQWHLHKNGGRRLGKYKMTHVWHLPKLKDAYGMSMPVKQFQRERAFESLPENGSGAGA